MSYSRDYSSALAITFQDFYAIFKSHDRMNGCEDIQFIVNNSKFVIEYDIDNKLKELDYDSTEGVEEVRLATANRIFNNNQVKLMEIFSYEASRIKDFKSDRIRSAIVTTFAIGIGSLALFSIFNKIGSDYAISKSDKIVLKSSVSATYMDVDISKDSNRDEIGLYLNPRDLSKGLKSTYVDNTSFQISGPVGTYRLKMVYSDAPSEYIEVSVFEDKVKGYGVSEKIPNSTSLQSIELLGKR